jgi:hypothetical protein
MSVVFLATATGEPKAGDDAKDLGVLNLGVSQLTSALTMTQSCGIIGVTGTTG